MEERFNKIEDKLSQLMQMVGSMKADQEKIKKDLAEMKVEQDEMKRDITEIKSEQEEIKNTVIHLKNDNEQKHKEISEILKFFKRDQDFVWQKKC